MALLNDDEVAVGLEARRHRPFDFRRIVNVDVHIDDDDLLDVVMAGEGAHHDVLGLAFLAFVDLHIEVVAADAAAREMDVADRREAAAQMRQQRRFARNAAKQQVFEPTTDDGVKHGVLAVRQRGDLDHMALGRLAVILRKLAERAFHLAHVRQHPAFDHDFGFGRHTQIAGHAFDHRQRRAMQRAGERQFVEVDRGDGLRCQQRQRIDTDDDGDVERLAGAFRHVEERISVARQDQRAETVRTAELQAVDRDVLHAGLGVARDQQAGGDVGAVVVFVVHRHRQLLAEIDLAMHDLLHRAALHFLARQRVERRVLIARQHLAGLDAHRLGNPLPVGHQAGQHRHRVVVGPRKQCRLVTVETLGDRRQLEAQGGAWLHHRQPVSGGQMIKPGAQRGDRLRPVARRRRCGRRCGSGHGEILSRQEHSMIDYVPATFADKGAPPCFDAIIRFGNFL